MASRGVVIRMSIAGALLVGAAGMTLYCWINRPRPAAISAPRTIDGAMGTIVAALPRDTTAVAAVRVRQLAALQLLPLGEPGFEPLDAILDQARACGVELTKDVELVAVAQRQHDLGEQATGRPSDARNLMFLHGAITPAILESCGEQLAGVTATYWLADDIVALAGSEAGRGYLDELEARGPRLPENPLFAGVARQLQDDAVGWGWMDTEAMRRAQPPGPFPATLFTMVGADRERTIEVTVIAGFGDDATARAVAQQWRTYTRTAPEGTLARLWQYTLTSRTLTARLRLPFERFREGAAVVAQMIRAF